LLETNGILVPTQQVYNASEKKPMKRKHDQLDAREDGNDADANKRELNSAENDGDAGRVENDAQNMHEGYNSFTHRLLDAGFALSG
jgi:hypothetical protein